jgi:AAA15 family ATPase/GTPase
MLQSVSLTNFRNYKQVEVDVGADLVLILGANASGKTNFLEAIYFLSASNRFGPQIIFLLKRKKIILKLPPIMMIKNWKQLSKRSPN